MMRLRRIDVFQADSHAPRALPPLGGEYVFTELDAEQLAACRMGREKNRAQSFRARLAEGHRAVGFLDGNGDVACYLWVSGGDAGPRVAPFESGLRVRLDPAQIYIWDCRTDPAHEGRGLYRHGLARIMEGLAGLAVTASIVSRRENTRSARAIEAAGFRRTGVIYALSMWGLVLVLSGASLRVVRAGHCIGMPSFSPCSP